MNFVVSPNKPGFSFVLLVAVFLLVGSLSFAAIVAAAKADGVAPVRDASAAAAERARSAKNPVPSPADAGSMVLQSAKAEAENPDVSPVFDRFDRWVETAAATATAAGDSLAAATGEELESGIKLAIEREQALKQLIATNPRLALAKSVSPDAARRLPAAIAAHLEKRVSAYGDLTVYVLEDIDRQTQMMNSSRIERSVTIGETRYEAYVYGRREAMTSKRNIPLQGIVVGDRIALDESPARKIGEAEAAARMSDYQLEAGEVLAEIGGETVRLPGEEAYQQLIGEQIGWESKIGPVRQSKAETKAEAETENALASSWTEGAKTVLVIRVDTSDRPGEPIDHYNQPLTTARAQSLFSNEVGPFYVSNSYGKTLLTATVTPVVRLPQTQTYYSTGTNYNIMLSDARAAARAAGFDTNLYSLDVVTFSYTPRIGWAGIAAVGDKSNMLNGAFYLPETSHELGHNYGLMHANFYRTSDGTSTGTGVNVEYGDCYDNMGACYNGDLSRHFNARYKRQLDWLTDADVQTVTSSGTFRIYAQDSSSQGIRALKIPTKTTKNYWVEFRQLMSGNAQNGALVRWENGQSYPETQLLDMNPGTATTRLPTDEALAIGQSFYDSVNQIKITVVGKGGTSPESLDVKVEVNASGTTPTAPPCTYALSPGGQTFTSAGGSGVISVTTPTGCSWSASGNSYWIALTGAFSGTGSGSIPFIVQPNFEVSARTATMTIAGQSLIINQAGFLPSLFDVSGVVTYGAAPGGQAVKYVDGVNFNGVGTSALSATSGSSGSYRLSGLISGGSYTVTATKSGDVNGINSLDATRIQQYLVGLTNLTPNQLIAADVDNNRVVNSLDAARMQQYLVGIPSANIIGQWRFVPGTRQYNAITNSIIGQNYEAVLVGEVSGNWSPDGFAAYTENEKESLTSNEFDDDFNAKLRAPVTGKTNLSEQISSDNPAKTDSRPESSATEASVTVSLPANATGSTGSIVTIPISIGELPLDNNIQSFDFSVFYDASVLQPTSPSGSNAGTLSSQCSVFANSPSAGKVKVSGACGAAPITNGSGVLYNLMFTVIGSGNRQTALSFTDPATMVSTFQFNDGTPTAKTLDKLFIVTGPTASEVSISGRVITARGKGIGGVLITMIDAHGGERTAQTSSFGYYRFDDVTAGETVTLSAKARRYRFDQPVIVRTANDQITNADFISQQ